METSMQRLTEKDLEEAANLFTCVFCSSPWNEPWSVKTSYKRLSDISLTPGYIGIGYFDSTDTLTGFLVGNVEQWADGKSFYIHEICVLGTIQQKGIGTHLLTCLTNILTEKKVDSVYLSTERGQGKPELFFSKNGFTTNEARVVMTMDVT
ncbi:GNAT family N-acetyltransferase [Peribacillus sp. NPDC097675]|uniref:GNAT family N-acetyltransferase n=1 Tax=Peribacillus sp. NPDC097675 TaxID=3390618 RepID=UPI003D06E63D